ncbi:class I SAM-dependent methyltransferase [bacterium]|nr:class I SAM-dependent methyltransferase [bacterium]
MKNQVFGKEYAGQYDLLYEDKDYEVECGLIEEILRRYANTPVKSVLDIGCGTGNHALPLAKRGYHVTGIDCSPEMISQARAKAQAIYTSDRINPVFREVAPGSSSDHFPPVFLEADARTLSLGRTFDAVLMMFAVLGYQLTNNDVLSALRAVRDHLKEECLFIFDIWYGPAVLAIRPCDKIKVIQTGDGQLIRAASSELDIRRHCCEVQFDGIVKSLKCP